MSNKLFARKIFLRIGGIILSALLLLIWVIPLVPTMASTGAFVDVPPGYWAATAISSLESQGAWDGVVTGATFSPEAPFTRGQLTTILQKAMGWTGANVGPPFTDVAPTDPNYPGILTVSGMGVMNGVGGGLFDPSGDLTRAQAVTIFVRALGLGHVADDLAGGQLPFTDAAAIPSWARGAAVVAYNLGLMQGSNGVFGPSGVLTRAQVAVMLSRIEGFTSADLSRVAVPAANYLIMGSGASGVNEGGTLGVWAIVHDRAGYVLPVKVQWTATGGTIQAGASTGQGGTMNHAVFTASGAAAGAVTASVPGTGISKSKAVALYQPTALQLVAVNPQMILAGKSVPWNVQVTQASGAVDPVDRGRTITATWSGPGGHQTAQVTDSGGTASFNLKVDAAGAYTVNVTANGLSEVSQTFQAVGSPLGTLQAVASGSVQPWVNSTLTVLAPGAPLSVPVSVYSTNPNAVIAVDRYAASDGTVRLSGGPIPGTSNIVLSDPGGAYLPVTVQASEAPQAQLAFTSSNYGAAAGNAVQIGVTIAGAGANGTQIALNPVSPTGVKLPTVTATTAGGVASFSLTETEAGAYQLFATAWGCADPVSPASLQVSPGSAMSLAAQVNPSPFLLPGQIGQVWAGLVDKYGNSTGVSFSAQASLVSGSDGILQGSGGFLQGGGQIGTFSAQAPGVATIQVTSPGYPTITLPVKVMASPAQAVAGKGMWLIYGDWKNNTDASLINNAKQEGITHIYLEVATTNDGFYGGPGLDDFLTKAHGAGIAVISWVYPALWDVSSDISVDQQVASYVTPTGQRSDGLAADIEENLDPTVVGQYAQAMRGAIGPNGLLVGVTYPALGHETYPYAALAAVMQVIAPMTYWHYTERDYTFAEAYNYVAYSIQEIRKLTGNPALDVEPIAQAYDMFDGGPYSPTVLEEQGAATAAQEGGGIGLSFYRLGSLDQGQIDFIKGLSWSGTGN